MGRKILQVTVTPYLMGNIGMKNKNPSERQKD
jgi:hypothetical protein